MMENLSGSSNGQVQENLFYLLHSNPPRVVKVPGNKSPSKIMNSQYLYYENTKIINSMIENLSGSSNEQMPKSLLHSYPRRVIKLPGKTSPSEVINSQYLYRENKKITNSKCPNLSLIPIEVSKQIVRSLNLSVDIINPMILWEVIYCLFYRQLQNLYPYEDTNRLGKWIMFFEKIEGPEGFDYKWNQCCKLYDEGKLNGITALMCTTGYGGKNSDMGIIFFFCGPKEDLGTMLEYGKHLQQTISYYTAYGFMFYKSFEQFSGGEGGSLISISVPKGHPSRFYLFDPSINSFNITELDGNVIPTEILNYRYLYHENGVVISKIQNLRMLPVGVCKRLVNCVNLNIINEDEETIILYEIIFNCLLYRNPNINIIPYNDTNKLGKWMMFFNNKIDGTQGFDQKWKECCKLYDEGKLSGIVALMCSTGFPTGYGEHHSNIGVIYFFCGPKDDKSKILEYGKNLLQFIPYSNANGYMYFKSYEHSKDDKQGALYEIPVPVPKDANRFYLFHSSVDPLDVHELNGVVIPTEILNFKYLYYENLNIVNSKFLKLRRLPLEVYSVDLNLNDEDDETGIVSELRYNYIVYKFPEMNTFPHENINRLGKWMMFFKKEGVQGLNQKWKEYCKLYKEGKLNGIAAIMCNTGYIAQGNVEYDSNIGAIFFICGPKNNHKVILEYGENLLKHMPYYSKYGFMFYKNYEHSMDGEERALCRLPVPKCPPNRYYLFHPSTINSPNITELDRNVAPSEILNDRFLCHENLDIINSKFLKLRILPQSVRTQILSSVKLNLFYGNSKNTPEIMCEIIYNYLYHRNATIENLFPYENTNRLGKWIMFFKKIDGAEGFDQKWIKCCKLYDEGKLNGIAALMCTTGFISLECEDHNSNIGSIFFMCGPKDDLSKMLEYGKNLLQLIPYHSQCGNMYYKSYEYSTENEGGMLCSIPVPVCPHECTHVVHCRQYLSVTDNLVVTVD